ncbi:MAG: hypothetical protein M0P31_18215 [Solirubrobacteraceae bacterium]|nr:hypothetical protein [Solirubrobacteraceae bacterium]
MSPSPDLTPLLPDDAQRTVRRDALVAELRRTPSAPGRQVASTRRQLVRGGLVAAGAVGLGLVGTTVTGTIGGGSVDLVDSARAAVAPARGTILHVLVRYEHGPYTTMGRISDGPDGPVRGTMTGDVERWSTDAPLRLREVWFLDPPGDGPQPTITTAYADGVLRERQSWRSRDAGRRRLTGSERRRYERLARGRTAGLSGVGASTDPVAVIRVLLDRGRLREDGRATVHGRDAQRLVGREPGYVDGGGTWSPPVDFEVLVDAETHAPVRVTTTQVLAARPDDPEPAARRERRIVNRWTFERFERLPMNDDTARLLTLDGADGR